MSESTLTLVEALVDIVRQRGHTMGDRPMISPMEWGWWVGGSYYVSKRELYSKYRA